MHSPGSLLLTPAQVVVLELEVVEVEEEDRVVASLE